MKHIFISDNIKQLALQYRDMLATGNRKDYMPPLALLEQLKDRLEDNSDKRYVATIIDLWEDMIVADPHEMDAYINYFDMIIPSNDIPKRLSKVKIFDKNSKKTKIVPRFLYKLIIEAMKYSYVQSTVYPQIISELGIRACVYCNAQYAFAVSGKYGYHNYELDHWKSKSRYPFLCTTFMNLQPCCATCNKKKSDKEPSEDEEVFRLFAYQVDVKYESPVKFQLESGSVVKYLSKSEKEKKLIVQFSCPDNPKLEKGFNHFFKINSLYQAHTDIAEELIWKSQIYNRVIIEEYQKSFHKLGFRESDFKRLILGNYDQMQDIHKRPLSKMTQDIAMQLHIIDEDSKEE